MRMDWNWLTPSAMWEQHETAKSEYEFKWPVGAFGLRRRPLRQWRWSLLIFWFVTLPLSILFIWRLV